MRFVRNLSFALSLGAVFALAGANAVFAASACGSGNGQTLSSAPAPSMLCAAGNTYSNGAGWATGWTWNCTAPGSSTVQCAATLASAGSSSCGSGNGQTLSSAPAPSMLCAAGNTYSNGAGWATGWTWNCTAPGASAVSCSASKASTGTVSSCGSANSQTLSSAPAPSMLCAAGNTYSNGAGWATGWTWNCTAPGASAVSCSASKASNNNAIVSNSNAASSSCGSANSQTLSSAPAPSMLCAAGNTYSNGAGWATGWTWNCTAPGASAVSCSASKASTGTVSSCGSANSQTLSSAPAPSMLCAAGNTYSNGAGWATGWTWDCTAPGASAVSCSASKASNNNALVSNSNAASSSCGSANSQTLSSAPAPSMLCAAGNTYSNGAGWATGWTWNCTAPGASAVACSATLQGSIINGTCGSAAAPASAAPASGLCSTGSASSVTGTGPWAWNCTGTGGGTTAACTAPLIVNGACGIANVKASATAPGSFLCMNGSPSTVTAGTGSYTGLWLWSCAGANGGTSTQCSSYIPTSITQPVDANGNIGATSYTNLPFSKQVLTNCWGCSPNLEPTMLFAQSNPQSIFNIFNTTYGAANAANMWTARTGVSGLETNGLVPFGTSQRWEGTWVDSFPNAFSGNGGATAASTGENTPDFAAWRDWYNSRPQLWDTENDGGTVPVFMRALLSSQSASGGGQWGLITPMTPLDAADCPPDLTTGSPMTSCTYSDFFAYRWSLESAIDGNYGMQLSDFSDSLDMPGISTNVHGFNPRVIAAFATQYGYTIPGTTVAQKSAWILGNAYTQWDDFYSQGYGNFFAALATRISAATGKEALISDQCAGGPFTMRFRATDSRIVLSKINPKNYACIFDQQTIQSGRYGPVELPIATELSEVYSAAYEPLARFADNLESDDSSYWNAIVSFYPTLTGNGTQTLHGVTVSGDQVEAGYKLMKRLWLDVSWAHIADRSGNVRRANAFAMRDYWDAGVLTAPQLGPLQSLIQTVVPTRPFGPAFYYSQTAMKAAESYFGQTQNTYVLCGGNATACANEGNAVETFLDTGGLGGYFVSDAALSQMTAGSANAPSAWIVPSNLYLNAYTHSGSSTPDPVTSMSSAEQTQLAAIAPIVQTPAALAALPNQPLTITTTGGPVAPSTTCKAAPYNFHVLSPINTALTGFGFYDQNGRLIIVVSNPSPCPDAVSLSGTISLKGIKVAGVLANASYTLTDLFAGTTSSLTVSGGAATIPVTLTRWDTIAFALTHP